MSWLNDDTSVQTTPHRCPECGGPIRMEVTRGEATSVAYECADCGKSFTLLDLQIAAMQRRLIGWVPEGSEVRRVHPDSPDPSREVVGWWIEYPDGVVCRVSFWTSEVEHSQDDLWAVIQSGPFLQGKSGNMRITLSGVMGKPGEWAGLPEGS